MASRTKRKAYRVYRRLELTLYRSWPLRELPYLTMFVRQCSSKFSMSSTIGVRGISFSTGTSPGSNTDRKTRLKTFERHVRVQLDGRLIEFFATVVQSQRLSTMPLQKPDIAVMRTVFKSSAFQQISILQKTTTPLDNLFPTLKYGALRSN